MTYPASLPPAVNFDCMVVGDLNGDGKMDIVAGPYWYEGPNIAPEYVVGRLIPCDRVAQPGEAANVEALSDEIDRVCRVDLLAGDDNAGIGQKSHAVQRPDVLYPHESIVVLDYDHRWLPKDGGMVAVPLMCFPQPAHRSMSHDSGHCVYACAAKRTCNAGHSDSKMIAAAASLIVLPAFVIPASLATG